MLKQSLLLCFTLSVFFGHVSPHQGTDILEGLTEVALRLLTPEGSTYEASQQTLLAAKETLKYDPDASAYFDFFPAYQGAVAPGSTLQFPESGSCFKNIIATATQKEDGKVLVTITLKDPVSLICSEGLVVATDSQFFVHEYFTQ